MAVMPRNIKPDGIFSLSYALLEIQKKSFAIFWNQLLNQISPPLFKKKKKNSKKKKKFFPPSNRKIQSL